jgi:hypothetical protein
MSVATLEEKKLRFHFTDGAMAGKSFDHTFHADGGVDWGPADGKTTRSDNAALVKAGDQVFVGSYLGEQGHTLTVVLDLVSNDLVAFASDAKSWSKQTGTFEIVG